MLELGIKILLSYLLGSLNGSLIIGRFTGVDIRKVGSGNAGGTNALRTQGLWFAVGVMVIDVGKGFLPAWLLPSLVLPGVFNFAGGKGAATLIGMLIAVAPALLLPGLITFAGVLVLTGFVGLATMTAVTVLPIVLWFTAGPDSVPTISALALLALFVIYTHRSNIVRMTRGEEGRMHKVMLFRRRHDEPQ